MPELPEVETIRRIVEPQVAGRTIRAVCLLQAQVVAHPAPEAFVRLLSEQTITSLGRRGKFLVFHFASGDRMVLHLRMTGQLLVTPPDFPMETHTHLVAPLSDGNELRYIDVRRFGRFWLLRPEESEAIAGLDRLGIEPLSEDLTGAYLREHFACRAVPIKAALLDQSVVCGIGNIYADEILYAARLHPENPCSHLSTRAWNRLAVTIRDIIAWGIETDAMTPEEYLAGKGKEYRNTPDLRAYGHEGKPCFRCGHTMKRVTIGGRSSCYCPYCQRKKQPFYPRNEKSRRLPCFVQIRPLL